MVTKNQLLTWKWVKDLLAESNAKNYLYLLEGAEAALVEQFGLTADVRTILVLLKAELEDRNREAIEASWVKVAPKVAKAFGVAL